MKTLLFVENAKALENINYQLEFMERPKIETAPETEYPRYFRVLKNGLKEVTTERGKQWKTNGFLPFCQFKQSKK